MAKKTETTTEKIEIDFSMDAIDRLNAEISATQDNLQQSIGKYLIEQLKTDSELKNAYFTRKITLEAVAHYVTECARKHLNGKSGGIDDSVVFGWVLHYVQDEDVKIPEKETYTLTKAEKEDARAKALKQYEQEQLDKLKAAEAKKQSEELKKAAKEIERKKIVEEEAKKAREESGQLSLFDFNDESDGDENG